VSSGDRQQRELFYSGNVQGVGFRYTVRSLASRFSVTGFVRNLPDGRVQLFVEGTEEEIKAFCDAVRREMDYYIKKVQRTDRAASGRFAAFEIRH
jgi:acylphosphatase